MTVQETLNNLKGRAPITRQLSGCLIVQRGTLMLQTADRAEHIARVARPDTYDPATRQGYQRLPNNARMRRLADYYRRGGKMPNTLLCNIRPADMEGVKITVPADQATPFEEARATGGNWIGIGTIEWEDELTFWVMDGQHRAGSGRLLVDADYAFTEFPVNLTITLGLSRDEETEEFFEVNSNQVNVATDLAQELLTGLAKTNPQIRDLLDESGKSWIVQGDLVFRSLETMEGPWRGRFLGANECKRRGDHRTLTAAQFVRSLKPVLDMPLFQRFDPDTAATFINAYWQGIQTVLPEPFE
jgi:DGQHR domain-containing protein